jgi:methylase of polypeptide subunit release factors
VIEQLLDDHPYALFLFSDVDETHWHLVNVRYDEEATRRRVYRRITVGPQERLRTAAERVALLDLTTLSPDLTGLAPLAIQQRHDHAFDVEAVTRKFFSDYRQLFEAAEAQIVGLEGEDLRLFTQLLFNRLLFITFLERKGWLAFPGYKHYLRGLWEDHQAAAAEDPEANFYRDRLTLLFFSGLNNPQSVDMAQIQDQGFLQRRIGQVPYLNGGLFEKERLDSVEGVTVPDAIFGPVFDRLIYHYNFTVTESTPLDVEVAVDPEMLGKIFEELVTGRHESGSYYTPKPIVAFMCREALKGYLADVCPRETEDGLTAFVDRRDAAQLHRPEGVLAALQDVRVCDLACGSGAYLVGMLHELIDLRRELFVSRGVDPRAVYDKKLEIIQRNLYGVDIDPFAVNIARLRLWLSLIVDFEGATPPPLPNLEFKIEVGDSLTGPAPGQLQPDLFHHKQVEDYFRLKGEFMTAHGPEKVQLRERIDELREEIAAWASDGGGEGFDWAVTFAEVFAGPGWDRQTMTGAMTSVVNAAGGQMELAPPTGRPAGFDIVVTNPPYVRQELLDPELKEVLKRRYPEVYRGTADLYVYFYARALHLLREGGVGSFISSNKWLRAGYGKKLRGHMAEKATVEAIVDFGDLPLFEATTYPMIIVFRKEAPEEEHALRALEVDDLAAVDRLSEVVAREAWDQLQGTFDAKRGWALVQPETLALLEKIRSRGMPFAEHLEGRSYRGVTTGLNRVFVIDHSTRERIIGEDPKSAEIIKPWLRGRDVSRWNVEPKDRYVIFTRRGIDIDRYPGAKEYLSQFKDRLMPGTEEGRKAGSYEWYEIQDTTAYYAEFSQPKIVWAKYGIEPAFAYDTQGYFCTNTVFIIPTDQLLFVGLLNSKIVQWFAQHTFNIVRGGYIEWIPTNVARIPIPTVTTTQHEAIEALVSKLLAAHAKPPAGSEPAGGSAAEGQGPHVEAWERELNELVYQVYGLEDEELAIIEGT